MFCRVQGLGLGAFRVWGFLVFRVEALRHLGLGFSEIQGQV